MPNRPKTYDEIVRRTVPEPDTSWRPTPEQEHQAHQGFRALDAAEHALFYRINRVLADHGHDLHHVAVEVERDHVIISGSVRDGAALVRVLDLIRNVEGVGSIDDQLVISAD
jgi:hypothetical protein